MTWSKANWSWLCLQLAAPRTSFQIQALAPESINCCGGWGSPGAVMLWHVEGGGDSGGSEVAGTEGAGLRVIMVTSISVLTGSHHLPIISPPG